MKHLGWKAAVAVLFLAASGSMLMLAQLIERRDIKPTMTMVGGKIVYDAAEAR